jgi:hypothetical protein
VKLETPSKPITEEEFAKLAGTKLVLKGENFADI